MPTMRLPRLSRFAAPSRAEFGYGATVVVVGGTVEVIVEGIVVLVVVVVVVVVMSLARCASVAAISRYAFVRTSWPDVVR